MTFAEIGVRFGDARDARLDVRQRGRGAGDGVLYVPYLGGDVLGRGGGLARERLHAVGNDREARARLARMHRLDAGIEREQRGLPCDALNERDDLPDAVRGGAEAAHGVIGGDQIGGGALPGLARGRDVPGRMRDAGEDVARGVGDGVDVGGGLLGGG